MTRVTTPPLPRHLCHYTTLEGLLGIVESKSIWASNASFLNDKAELTHALKASRLTLKLLSNNKQANKRTHIIEKAFDALSGGEQKTNTYVACFCNEDDNLSQWRGYGGSKQGVCITFDRRDLAKRLSSSDARLLKVNYTRLTTAPKLRDALLAELDDIDTFNDIIGDDGSDEDELYEDLLSRISAIIPRFKHLGFKDEREWRFVIQKKNLEKSVLFRVIENKIVPYIVVGKSRAKLPITAIKIGPGADQELTKNSVESYMRSKGYSVDISMSQIPFRL